jgi:hypothetical protein
MRVNQKVALRSEPGCLCSVEGNPGLTREPASKVLPVVAISGEYLSDIEP